MKLTVFGPTGATGEQIVVQALAVGHHVTAVARRPEAVGLPAVALTGGVALTTPSTSPTAGTTTTRLSPIDSSPPPRPPSSHPALFAPALLNLTALVSIGAARIGWEARHRPPAVVETQAM